MGSVVTVICRYLRGKLRKILELTIIYVRRPPVAEGITHVLGYLIHFLHYYIKFYPLNPRLLIPRRSPTGWSVATTRKMGCGSCNTSWFKNEGCTSLEALKTKVVREHGYEHWNRS